VKLVVDPNCNDYILNTKLVVISR
ncbi:hypothetical protein LCGC14_2317460, partial [marine sediment metagenome]